MSELEGNWMKVMRLAKGLTLADAAAYADVTPTYLALVETNRARPSVTVLYWMAEVLGNHEVALALWPFVAKVPVKTSQPMRGGEQDALF